MEDDGRRFKEFLRYTWYGAYHSVLIAAFFWVPLLLFCKSIGAMKFTIFVVLWLIPVFSLMALDVMPAIFVAYEAILIAAFAIIEDR